MKLVKFTCALVVILVLLTPAFLSLEIRKIPHGFQPSLSDSQAIDKETSIKQFFEVENNNLSAIGLSIKNPYFRNSQDLFFSLYDNQGQQIRSVTLNGKNIADGNFLIINFDPIVDSGGKTFSFTLTSPGVESASSLEVYHSTSQSSPTDQYLVNNQLKTGTVSFIYFWSPSNPIANLLVIYRNWLTKLFQDLFFAIFYTTLITCLLGYLILTFSRQRN